jgi:hypothetical protein
MFKSPPKDLRIEVERITGFYRGVVEDNVDPLKAGRVRVRIHGLHTPNIIKSETEGIPVDELPWAEPCLLIHEGSVSGFGVWNVPLQGSHVMLFFENGNVLEPRYFASMPGIPESKEAYSNSNRVTSKNDGFKDPKGEYPTKYRLGEPDVHRLARGKSEGTLVETKNTERDIGVPTALGNSWSEPESPYAARYPHNHVIATHGGITIELDSTPGATRLNIYHPSNSFIEIDNEGNMVIKNGGQKYEIVTQGKNIHIKQDRNLTIDANHKRKVNLDEQIEIGGDKEEEIDGDMSQSIRGSKTEDIDVDKNEEIGGDKSIDIVGNETKNIGGNKTDDITGSKTKDVGGNEINTIIGNKIENIGGNLVVTVVGTSTLTAPTINLVGPVYISGFLSVAGDGGGEGGVITGTIRLESGDIIVTGGDVIADGISLKTHIHGGVDSGSSNTDPPS